MIFFHQLCILLLFIYYLMFLIKNTLRVKVIYNIFYFLQIANRAANQLFCKNFAHSLLAMRYFHKVIQPQYNTVYWWGMSIFFA